jgi:murein DD-endopeptidase MepM/ murein hydrolase activator NlpD
VPPKQRFPHARRSRRLSVRLALIGAAGALAVVLVVAAAGPRGRVLDLKAAGDAPVAVAQGLMPAAPVQTTLPAPAGTPNPRVGLTTRPAVIATGVPPNRLAAELTGTKAPSLDLLTGYRWPVAKVRLTLPFGPTPWGSRVVQGQLFHDGIDLATFCGDRVTAAHDGVVIAAGRHYDTEVGWVGDLGPYLRRLDAKKLWSTLPIMVVTDDGNGYRSLYAHFGRIVVKNGQAVQAGQLLGYEGATGRASGCHVHYGLFSPWETDTFGIRPDVVKRMMLPKAEIARVDPLKVLPPKAGVNAPKAPGPSPSPSQGPSPSP